MDSESKVTLVLGGTGKTGRRVAQRLVRQGHPVRVASRNGTPRFDWDDERTWGPALEDVGAAYVVYAPDVALPEASERVRSFSHQAVEAGVRRIVLLSGRGEPQVLPAEQAVRQAGAASTILRCAFFAQNFDEGLLAPQGGEIAFPDGAPEPFVDLEDVADVAVAALTSDAHASKTYDLTGPELLTCGQAASAIAAASGRSVRHVPVSFSAYGEFMSQFMPADQVAFFIDLFRHVLDGHNAHVGDGVEHALGRKPRSFGDYARAAAAAGAWR